jgi:SH3-like domain-containing protein
MTSMRVILMGVAALGLLTPSVASAQLKAPYWASISAGKARMRTGPGREFPANWLYQRSDLPVRVIESYPNWRKIEDPDGTKGWVQANLLSNARTAMVTGDVRELRASADVAAPVVWRAEPGVVGRISQCARGWCLFDVKGRAGYIQTAHIWGAAPDERLP